MKIFITIICLVLFGCFNVNAGTENIEVNLEESFVVLSHTYINTTGCDLNELTVDYTYKACPYSIKHELSTILKVGESIDLEHKCWMPFVTDETFIQLRVYNFKCVGETLVPNKDLKKKDWK